MRRRGLTVGPMRRLYTFPYLRNGRGFQADVRQSIKSISPLIGPTVRPGETATKLILNKKKTFIELFLKKNIGAGKVGAGLTTHHFGPFGF